MYRYYGKLAMIPNDGHLQYGDASADDRVTFTLSGAPEYVTRDTGQALRAVIQAGKNVTAVFSSDISNTSTTSNAGRITNTLAAPEINTPAEKISARNGSTGAGWHRDADRHSPGLD